VAFRRGRTGEPEADDLRELLHGLEYGLDRTAEQVVADLQHVVAMLSLDTPADAHAGHSSPCSQPAS